jgi:hypothetical protein
MVNYITYMRVYDKTIHSLSWRMYHYRAMLTGNFNWMQTAFWKYRSVYWALMNFLGGQRQAQYREIKRVLTSCWRMIVGRISAYSRLWCYNAMQHPSHLPLQPNVEKCHRLLIWVYFTNCFHEQKYFSSQFLYFNTTRFKILHNDK